MNRFGWGLAGVFLLALGAFLLMIRPEPTPAPRTVTIPVSKLKLHPVELIIPVRGVAASALVDSFDQARGGDDRRHGAIDIMASQGTAVLAAMPGKVEKLFESERGGHTIYVRSPTGAVIFYYAHLDHYAPGLHEGQTVQSGDVIGAVGSSGDADPGTPHLHFEIKRMKPGEGWWQGEAINPYPLLARSGVSR